MTVRTISGVTIGPVPFGTYSTITVTSLGGVTEAVTGVSGIGVLLNDGRIAATSIGVDIYSGGSANNQTFGWIQGGTTAGGTGVLLVAGGAFANSGHVYGNDGVNMTGGTVTNALQGLISGSSAGILGSGTVTNAGTIVGGSTAGVAVQFQGTSGNLLVVDPSAAFIGTVAGGGAGNTLEFATGAGPGAFTGLGSQYVNFALISIDHDAVWTASGINSLASTQTLTAAGYFYSAGQFTNTGVVVAAAGRYARNGGGIAQFGGTFANDRSVTATSAYYDIDVGNGGLVTNSAMATVAGGSFAGVFVDGPGTLINAGLISGGSDGAYARGSGRITNLAGGIIIGTRWGFAGVETTLVNAGTIAAGTSTNDAVHIIRASTARVVVDPGAVFVGTVDGFNTIGASAVSTLEFASGSSSGTFSELGSRYVNFAQISIDAGATWTASGTNTVVAGQTLADSGALTFAAAPVGGGSLAFTGHGITLASEGAVSFGPTIGGLLGNTIELLGVTESFTSLNGQNLTLSGGTTLTLAGTYSASQMGVTSAGGDTFITACFAGGTTIVTARGLVTVEALCVGERVLCVSGRLAPVVWIGHRLVDLRRHARPFDVMPVRVRAGALSAGVPARDVVLSPDHAVLVAGVLVPVRYLINGRSILQETREAVTYWHVALDRHDAVLAEGMVCESYLDTGNRDAFEGEAVMALHPAFGRDHALAVWEKQACAPILFEPREPALRAMHTRLMARAERQAATAATATGAMLRG